MASSSPARSSPRGLSDSSSPVNYNTPGSTPVANRTPVNQTPRSMSSHVPRTPTSQATPRRSELGSQSRHMVQPRDGGDREGWSRMNFWLKLGVV
eukprot:7895-Amorphochlora_amoeboformis.AAC.1